MCSWDVGRLQRLEFRADSIEVGCQLGRCFPLGFSWKQRERVKGLRSVFRLEGFYVPKEVSPGVLHQQAVPLVL